MSYHINEVYPAPVAESLQLEVDDEIVATAKPLPYSTVDWRIEFGEGLIAGTTTEEHARELLTWLGEKLSPLREISGYHDLDRAAPGSLWSSEYNDGNVYRRDVSGGWSYNEPTGYDWYEIEEPYHKAYPLKQMT